jgi:hypothetical protein
VAAVGLICTAVQGTEVKGRGRVPAETRGQVQGADRKAAARGASRGSASKYALVHAAFCVLHDPPPNAQPGNPGSPARVHPGP